MSRRIRQSASTATGAFCLAVLATPAHAQSPAHDFDIPRESLSKALRDYGQASGRQLIFTENLVAQRTAPAVKGRLAADDALRLLLRDSGLTFQQTRAGAVMI
ncbi:MAG: STN domain-containing protein, partial [Phenylobacterium sp.]|nr:STN domain-containing protein [Phenylobacterium sp.]